MTDSEMGMYERELTPAEIEERKALNLDLQSERDENLAEVDQKRRQIRALNAARKKLELRSAEVRREIRSGKVLESRQTSLAFAGEGPRHGEGPLLDAVELRHLITCVVSRELWPTVKEVERWHEQVRADVQKWCRVEHTHANPIAGLPLPLRSPLPNVLENIKFRREEERKASKRKAPPTAHKRKKVTGAKRAKRGALA
jgi:hypothetical protein